jgi:hypothetical protein
MAFVLMAIVLAPVASATVATSQESRNVVENWLTFTANIEENGWNGTFSPSIESMDEIYVDGRLVGRCYNINPSGYVITPILREMTPIKLYSTKGRFDISLDQGMPALIKEVLDHHSLLYIDNYGSMEAAQSSKEYTVFAERQFENWDRYSVTPSEFGSKLGSLMMDPMESYGPLLPENEWDQGYPWNNLCPPGDGCSRCPVGCVATAASQIMHYWQCPPAGVGQHSYIWAGDGTGPQTLSAEFSDPYDWDLMPDKFVWPWGPENEAAVAELCYEVGVALDMDYACDGSGAYGSDVRPALTTYFRFDTSMQQRTRTSMSYNQWFNIYIKNEIMDECPIQMFMTSHSVVMDGWRNTGGVDQYHLNYGWGGSHNSWYGVDDYFCPVEPDPCYMSQESILINMFPDPDFDNDGIPNVEDNCDLIANPGQADMDDDNVGDDCDNCLYTYNPDQGDADGDGIGDYCETDADDDGIPNELDNCWLVPNNLQENSDSDVFGDSCDNCPYVENPEQYDEDGDGEGDFCDGDFHIQSYQVEIPNAYLNQPYFYQFWAVGGIPDYTWDMYSGSLPWGCVFNDGAVGTISGTPTWMSADKDVDTNVIWIAVYDAGDPQLADSAQIYIFTHRYPDYCPVLDEIGDRSVGQGDTLDVAISATDSNETYPDLICIDMPENSSFTDNGDGTGMFEFCPVYEQIGEHDVLFIASDGVLQDSEWVTFTVTEFSYVCGDADGSQDVDIDDAVYLITYIFSGGPAPDPYESGDADCSGEVDIDDVVFVITYIFGGGPAPCDTDGNGVPDC